MAGSLTSGVHHVGLAVPDLAAAEAFFTEALGWTVTARRPEYPAAFVSDGTVMITLWQLADPDTAVPFDRRRNAGLHHLALAVADTLALSDLFARVAAWPGVVIEFAPEPIRPGAPVEHFICAMPGGLRIEFATRAPAQGT